MAEGRACQRGFVLPAQALVTRFVRKAWPHRLARIAAGLQRVGTPIEAMR